MKNQQRSSSRIHKPGQGIILGLIAFTLISLPLFAQAPPPGDDGTLGATSSVAAPVKPANTESIMKELDTMKKRIAELELQLATQQAVPATDSKTNGSAGTNSYTAPTLSGVAASPVVAPLNTNTPMQDKPAQPTTGTIVKAEPFAFADWTWLSGNPRTKDVPMDTKFFTPEIRFDVDYNYDMNHPQDDTIGGSTEAWRSNEIQVTQIGVGGDFHFDNVRGRLMTQFGLLSTTTPRNDASPARGQWDLADAYRYLSEAYGGYHWNKMHGINLDAGIFMSYIGLWSYYNFDNWTYQPSYVSSNTPWFFNGVRLQLFPTEKLKIEPWLINGWQSYGRFNNRLGIGGQILYRPNGSISMVFNNYGLGRDTLGVPGRTRFHTDDSIQVKYYDHPERFLDKSAFTFTVDLGCESGGGVSCFGTGKNGPKQSFVGFMFYDRIWFHKDRYAWTFGGGAIDNPGRYLVLLPPINGATAATGSPYFTGNPGDPFKAWDVMSSYDYMPSQYITFRWEFVHRASNVPYFSGSGGITPPGGDTGDPTAIIPGWVPDLRKRENRASMAILVKF